jgi:hydroxymethylpyrimidine/phosphomethylpyrimidine kinase
MTAVAVSIAGSDPTGGAGIAADLKTFFALGVYGAPIVTVLTAQNSKGIHAIHPVPAEFVAAQMDAVFSDLAVSAVKIGMVWRADVIETVAAGIARWHATNIVLDPVMAATAGGDLLLPEAREALKRTLCPHARVLTPNLPEAAALLDVPMARTEEEMQEQARRLLAFGPQAVLIKGGHAGGADSVDFLVEPNACSRFVSDRIAARNTHGTGCTLSSAIAAGLAKGIPLRCAVGAAKDFVTAALAAADKIEIGSGEGHSAPFPHELVRRQTK